MGCADLTKTLCFTGHRPNKLNGYNISDNLDLLRTMKREIEYQITENKVSRFISGMALGVDMWSALIVLGFKPKYPHIKLECAVPCAEQYSRWNKSDREMWFDISRRADKVVYVSEEPYTAWCMQKRNEYMVDNSDYVLAVWDESKGGTANCVKYAKKKKKEIYIIDPVTAYMKGSCPI